MIESASPAQSRPRSYKPLISSWEAFDRLFDDAFAPGSPRPEPSYYRDSMSTIGPLDESTTVQTAQTPKTTKANLAPLAPISPAEEPLSDVNDEDFNQLWNEAASRRRQITRTVTRRRTLHQGAMSPDGMSTVQDHETKMNRRRSRCVITPS